MIKKLLSENYRAFEKLEIPCAKINLFFGPNNSGKSAILSVLPLLAQTLRSSDPGVPLLFKGAFEDLGTYEDVVHGNDVSRNITLGLELEGSTPEWEADGVKRRIEVTFHYRKPRRQIVVESLRLTTDSQVLLSTRVAKVSKSQLIEDVGEEHQPHITKGPSSSGHIELNHFIPDLGSRGAGVAYSRRRGERASAYKSLAHALWEFERYLRGTLANMEFIGPFRSNPERIYPFSGEAPLSVGVHGDNAVGILVSDEYVQRSRKQNLASKVSAWFRESGIAKQVSIVPISGRHFEVRLTHIHTGEMENIADAGYGCSQILPILVAGYHMAKDRALLIAQPEIHLHPKAEAEVGTFLYEVAKRGIQLFVETHGVHLMLRLQSHVASGDIQPEDINVFCVYSDQRTGEKHCRRIPIGKDGFFEEEWPSGFFTERLDEAKRLARFSV
jgi:hypothetical protein